MPQFFSISFFIFGAIIGSFLNVVILRMGSKSLGGRSMCFSCGKELRWFELVPILSFLFLRGRCSSCRSKISWQYPAVEFFTGLIFLGVFAKSGAFLSDLEISFSLILGVVLELLIWCILIVITAYDLKHKIIPDSLVFSFAGLSLFRLLLVPLEIAGVSRGVPFLTGWNLLSGPIFALPFFLLWLVSRGKWIGLGDAKLALGIGWFMGLSLGFSSILLGFWIGAGVGIILMILSKLHFLKVRIGRKTELPFAPFLILGVALTFFWGIDVLNLDFLNFQFSIYNKFSMSQLFNFQTQFPFGS